MKKFTALIVVAIIIVGGYSGLWFYNAGKLEIETGRGIAFAQGFVGPEGYSYSSFNVSGFPGSINVNVNNVNLSYPGIPFTGEIKKLSLSRGIFRNTLTFSEGPYYRINQLSESGEKVGSISYKARHNPATIKFKFKGSDFGNFLSGKMSFNPFQGKEISWNLLKEVESIEIKSDGAKLYNERTGETYLDYGPSSLEVSQQEVGDQSYRISFLLSQKDMEFTPAFDNAVKEIILQYGLIDLLKSARKEALYLNSINFSIMGKRNADIDIVYEGPLGVMPHKENSYRLDINKFILKDALQAVELKGFAKAFVDTSGELKEAKVNLAGKYKASEKLNDYLKEFIITTIKEQMLSPQLKDPEQLKKFEKVIDDHADDIIPNFYKLGEIHYAIDTVYTHGPRKLNINNLSLSTIDGGLAVNGSLTEFDEPASAKFKFKLRLIDYKNLISGFSTYTANLKKATLGKDEKEFHSRFEQELNQFILEAADENPQNAKDAVITITNDNGQFMFGKLNTDQIKDSISKVISLVSAQE